MEDRDQKKAALGGPPRPYKDFAARYPDVSRAYEALGEAARGAGPLTEREIAIVKLGISIGARMEGATHAHTRKALAAGVEPDALRHVAVLSVPTLGFPTMMMVRGWVEETLRPE